MGSTRKDQRAIKGKDVRKESNPSPPPRTTDGKKHSAVGRRHTSPDEVKERIAFGRRLKNTRENTAGMTQADLAKKLGVIQQSVWKYENGKCFPGPGLLRVIAQVLKTSIDELLGVDVRRSRRKLVE